MGVYLICLGWTRFLFVHPHYNKIIYDFFNEHPKLNKCRFQGVIKNTKRHFYYQRSIPPNILFWHMLMNIQDAEKNLLPVGSWLTKSHCLLNVGENFMPILSLSFGNISTHVFKFSFLWYMQKTNKMSVWRQKREKFWNYVIWNCWQLIYICFVFSVVFQKLWFFIDIRALALRLGRSPLQDFSLDNSCACLFFFEMCQI